MADTDRAVQAPTMIEVQRGLLLRLLGEGNVGTKIVVLIVVLAVCTPLSILAVGRVATMVAQAPGAGLESVVRAFTVLLDNKTTVSLNQNVVTITPISEIALARQTVRLTTVYKRSWGGSECVVVAEQDYAVKYGYDTTDVFRVIKAGGEIDVPEAKVLSVEPASGAPKVLFQQGGLYNRVAPEDMTAIAEQLYASVKSDRQVKEYQQMLRTILYNQLKALQMQLDDGGKAKTTK